MEQINSFETIYYTPIVYNSPTDYSNIKNVILVDNSVYNYTKFVENCNSNTFAITFNKSSNPNDIKILLAANFSSIDRIAIVTNNSLLNNKWFLGNKPYFELSDLVVNNTTYSSNIEFLIDIIKTHNVKNIDFLASNTLINPNWTVYYELLIRVTGVVVGASSDTTGSIEYGEYWDMYITKETLESIYFSSGISNYQDSLDTTILTEGGILKADDIFITDSSSSFTVKWPITLNSNVTVTFEDDLKLNSISNYFIIVGDNSIIDGNGYTVEINTPDYLGLVYSESNTAIVRNIGVVSSNLGSLAIGSGWIGQSAFRSGFLGNIYNCYSNGSISAISSGGIVGFYAGYRNNVNNNFCIITNCYSLGVISGADSGGIVSNLAGYYNCNCYVDNCFSSGDITGVRVGGISGAYFSDYNSNNGLVITNCYSSGNIGLDTETYCGGIIGGSVGVSTYNNCIIRNCYVSGILNEISGTNGTIQPLNSNVNIIDSGNSSGWDDITATSYLDNTDGTWKQIYINQPWKLSIFLNDTKMLYLNDILEYTSKFSINTKNYDVTIGLYNNIEVIQTIENVSFKDKIIQFNLIDKVLLPDDIIYLVAVNNLGDIIEYIDLFTILPNPTKIIENGTLTFNGDFIFIPTSGDSITITWPIILNGNITLTINSNLTFNNKYNYFIITDDISNNVIIDGNNNTIEINVTDYIGLVESKSINTIIKNIGVTKGILGSLGNNSGWLGQGGKFVDYSGFIGTIQNCYSTGEISGEYSGGIVGTYAGYGKSLCKILNCYSTGNISGNFSGGIVGAKAGHSILYSSSSCIIENCYSSGNISGYTAGGIVGAYAGYGSNNGTGSCSVFNCYSSGFITGQGAGGISGQYAGYGNNGNGLCTIKDCYSTGKISGYNSGGISGGYSGYGKEINGNGFCSIENCYSIGEIAGSDSGGIVGSYAGKSYYSKYGYCKIANCYSTGNISGYNSGGIVGSYSGFSYGIGDCIIENCYSTGNINGNEAGGIAGAHAGYNCNNDRVCCKITNCYSSGTIGLTSTYSGGIIGSSSYRFCSMNNCYVTGNINIYSTNGTYQPIGSEAKLSSSGCSIGWDDIKAEKILTNSNNIWKPFYNNQPWKLNAFLDECIVQYSNTDVITYTSNYPINLLLNGVSVCLYHNNLLITNKITQIEKTIDFNIININNINFELPFYLVVLNNTNSIIEYANIFTITAQPTALTESGVLSMKNTNYYFTKNNGTIITVGWPITLTSNVNVTFGSNLILKSTNDYFIVLNTTNVIIDGSGYKVTIDVPNYLGLVKSNSNNAIVKNIGIATTSIGTLANHSGWIGQGGINNGFLGTIEKCYSTGEISGEYSGGIVGSYAGYGNNISSLCKITNCYSVGSITGLHSGGISGSYLGYGTGSTGIGSCIIEDCYSIGVITSNNSGGIAGSFCGCGENSGSGFCSITKCYSTGNINGLYCGGIIGSFSGNISNGTSACSITNCYTIGNIGTQLSLYCGGILGANAYNTCNVSNCYVSGIVNNTSDTNSIFQPTNSNANIINSGSNNGWDDTIVSSYLTDISTVWKQLYNKPWKLKSFLNNNIVSYYNKTLEYTSEIPIISYTTGINFRLYNNSLFLGESIDVSKNKTLQFNKFSGFNNTLETYLVVCDNTNTIIDYVDSFRILTDTIKENGTIFQTENTFMFNTSYGVTLELVWPIKLSGNITIKLDNLVLNSVSNYFIITGDVSNNVVIDGSNNIIEINVNNYIGLVSSESNKTIIKNIGIISALGTLADKSGWIGQGSDTKGFLGKVKNCYSKGSINGLGSGGILGKNAGYAGTSNDNANYCFISNCYTTGTISGSEAGGIIGNNSTSGANIICEIDLCYSTGNIVGLDAGGIVGKYAGYGNNQNVSYKITNCYSIGTISGNSAGGITGSYASCNVENCYSTGVINGNNCGGITGAYTGIYNNYCDIKNCYTTGNIGVSSTNCGGIIGNNSVKCNINNCYVTGTVNTVSNTNGIFKPTATNVEINSSNGSSSGWDDINANMYLANVYITWKQFYKNKPWKQYLFLKDTRIQYNNDVLTYTSVFPISSYGSVKSVKLYNNNQLIATNSNILNGDKQVTFNNVIGINNSLPTYLVLFDSNEIVIDYVNYFVIYPTTINKSGVLTKSGDELIYVTNSGETIPIQYPISISGNITFSINTDILINNINFMFVITDDIDNNVTIDGNNNKVIINVKDYLGLVQSRTNKTIVKNIKIIISSVGSLAITSNNAAQRYDNNTGNYIGYLGSIKNSYNICAIGVGGIAGYCGGYYSGLADGYCKITNTTSTNSNLIWSWKTIDE